MNQLHVDVAVVGAGPAGLAATTSAARARSRVALVDDNPTLGGQIWRGGESRPPHGASRWLHEVKSSPYVTHLSETRVVAAPEPDVLLVERPDGTLQLRFARLVIATGARERFLPFPGWTLPGVAGAGGLQALIKGGWPIAGKRVVVAGSGPLLVAVAAFLRQKGADVAVVAEQAPWLNLLRFARHLLRYPSKARQAVGFGMRLRGVPFRPGSWVIEAHGDEWLEGVTLRGGDHTWTEACDHLACGFGLVPNLELAAATGCAIENDVVRVDEWQQTSRQGIFAAGEVSGIGGVEKALIEGQIAGLAATERHAEARALFDRRASAGGFATLLDKSFALRPELRTLPRSGTLVCRCEDVPYDLLLRHPTWRSAKLHTRCGMGPCQGRICGSAATFLFGWTSGDGRPPVRVTRVATLAASDTRETAVTTIPTTESSPER